MIRFAGRDWGTAHEIAQALGADITPAMVRRWAERDSLQAIHVPGPGRGVVRYPLDQAAAIEAQKRRHKRGRPRRLDFNPALV